MTEPRIALQQQIAEVRREIALRRAVYPRRIARHEMRQGEADLAMARIEAVLATLTWLQTHEHELRRFLAMAPADRAVVMTHGPLVTQMALQVARREANAKAGGPVR